MSNTFLRSLKLKNFLSFGPESKDIELTPLNVLIGPNASGKSNFIEAIELLHATPTDLAGPIRFGGTAGEWLWKGKAPPDPATIEARLASAGQAPDLRYILSFTQSNYRLELVDEALENALPQRPAGTDVFFYYRFQKGHPVIQVKQTGKNGGSERRYVKRPVQRESLNPQQSIFSQRKDPDQYPEITSVGQQFGRIQIFREWSFGRTAPLRQPQPADLPSDSLHPTIINLGIVLNDLEHRDGWTQFLEYMPRFLPRFQRLTTKIEAGSVQIYLHEEGLKTPVPATRLSDGTIRFMALLAILLNPEAAPLICIEEPELGMHPDMLTVLADLIIAASVKTQLVVTTHSETLVSALSDQAGSVVVCEYHQKGTTFLRLEQEKLKDWLQRYSLGELWLKGELGGVRW